MTFLAKFTDADGKACLGHVEGESVWPIHGCTIGQILDSESPQAEVKSLSASSQPIPLSSVTLLPPIDTQEVWAAGVTYKRSCTARMEESEAAASCYDRVYASPRPELFFKATAGRVVGHGEAIRIRADSQWNVPEPEVTLAVNSHGRIVGLTVGNDMSSRDIEGDNPLYLPQAKVYDQCCGLGPWIALVDPLPAPEVIAIRLEIVRAQQLVFEAATLADQMARTFEELVDWLFREQSFPQGVYLMTGTGIVPGNDFTLQADDEISIHIDGVGVLKNRVVQNDTSY